MMQKNLFKYLLPAAIIVIALVVLLVIKLSKNTSLITENNLSNNIKDAEAQVYTAPKTPAIVADDKIFGPKDAQVKVFVYEDYSSKYSANLADTLEKIRLESDNKLAVIIRPFASNISPVSIWAAAALDCAQEQGKWIEMRALLFAQAKNDQLSDSNYSAYTKQIGLDEQKFSACLTNLQKSEKIEKLATEFKGYSVQGAPTMFINDEIIIGARPYADFIDSNGDKIKGLKTIIDSKLQ